MYPTGGVSVLLQNIAYCAEAKKIERVLFCASKRLAGNESTRTLVQSERRHRVSEALPPVALWRSLPLRLTDSIKIQSRSRRQSYVGYVLVPSLHFAPLSLHLALLFFSSLLVFGILFLCQVGLCKQPLILGYLLGQSLSPRMLRSKW